MSPADNLDELSLGQLRELVLKLFSKLAELEKVVADQRLEIPRLKGLKGRPDIKPSGMDKGTDPAKPDRQQNRPGRGKITPRVNVEDRILSAAVPAGSRFRAGCVITHPL